MNRFCLLMSEHFLRFDRITALMPAKLPIDFGPGVRHNHESISGLYDSQEGRYLLGAM